MRGALANVTNARWDAVDADGASDVRAGCVRRSRVVLMSRCWHQAQERRKFLTGDGGKRAVLRGEHEVSRKAIAQGRPGCSACTCMLVCSFVCANRTRERGCSVHPVFPAPSMFRRDKEHANLGRSAPRDHRFTSDVPRRHREPAPDPRMQGRTTASSTAYTACRHNPSLQ
jgi:hypothetical protein